MDESEETKGQNQEDSKSESTTISSDLASSLRKELNNPPCNLPIRKLVLESQLRRSFSTTCLVPAVISMDLSKFQFNLALPTELRDDEDGENDGNEEEKGGGEGGGETEEDLEFLICSNLPINLPPPSPIKRSTSEKDLHTLLTSWEGVEGSTKSRSSCIGREGSSLQVSVNLLPLASHCNLCGKSSSLRCMRCFGVFYCSKLCQAIDWRRHCELCNPTNPNKEKLNESSVLPTHFTKEREGKEEYEMKDMSGGGDRDFFTDSGDGSTAGSKRPKRGMDDFDVEMGAGGSSGGGGNKRRILDDGSAAETTSSSIYDLLGVEVREEDKRYVAELTGVSDEIAENTLKMFKNNVEKAMNYCLDMSHDNSTMKKSSSDDDLTKREIKENDFKPSDIKSDGEKEEMKSTTRNDQEREHEVKEDSDGIRVRGEDDPTAQEGKSTLTKNDQPSHSQEGGGYVEDDTPTDAMILLHTSEQDLFGRTVNIQVFQRADEDFQLRMLISPLSSSDSCCCHQIDIFEGDFLTLIRIHTQNSEELLCHGHEDERGQSLIRFIAPDLINDKENPDQVKMRYLLMSPSGRILGSSTEMEIMDSHCEEVEGLRRAMKRLGITSTTSSGSAFPGDMVDDLTQVIDSLISEESIQEFMVMMAVDKSTAEKVLRKHGGNMAVATEWCFNNFEEFEKMK